MDFPVVVEHADALQDVPLRRFRGNPVHAGKESRFLAGLFLAPDVDPRGGILSHQDYGEPRNDAGGRLEPCRFGPQGVPDLPGCLLAVDEDRHYLTWYSWTKPITFATSAGGTLPL